jgi:heterotetrameric sarcosine oxidase gamma subunit
MPDAAQLSMATSIISERTGWTLTQFHAWPESFSSASRSIAAACGASSVPAAGQTVDAADAVLLRVHPQRLWLLHYARAGTLPDLPIDQGVMLDLSQSRCLLRIAMPAATDLIAKFCGIDLREAAFPLGAVRMTSMHRIPVTLWREANHVAILSPRSFTQSLREVLEEASRRTTE